MTLPIAVIVATKDRADDFRALANQLSKIQREFELVVVSDASDEINFHLNSLALKSTLPLGKFMHLRAPLGSLTRQKNQALDFIRGLEGIEAFQVFDDDTIPSPNYMSKSFAHLRELEAIGVSGLTAEVENVPQNTALKLFGKVFALSGSPGSISRAGIGIPHRPGTGIQNAEWLMGCSMWSIEASVFRYRKELVGSALFEDVDFSCQFSKERMYVISDLRLEHRLSVTNRPDVGLYWFRFGRNRHFLVQEGKITLPYYIWGSIGLTLQIALGGERGKWSATTGLWRGIASAVTGGKVL